MISVVINADTRKGYLTNEKTSIGDYAPGGQEGARSVDFLTDGIINKMNFFKGYETQCVLYIDEPIPSALYEEIKALVDSYGNNSKLIVKQHDRSRHRWYDYIYIEALKQADGDYVVHFDTDTAAFRREGSDIIDYYIALLDLGVHKYISLPMNEQSWWASTRFFICKRETLRVHDLENCLFNEYLAKHYGRMMFTPYPCCLEHTLGLMVQEGQVYYPPRTDSDYIIFCWVTYYKGTLARMNKYEYDKIYDIIKDNIHRANDFIDNQL